MFYLFSSPWPWEMKTAPFMMDGPFRWSLTLGWISAELSGKCSARLWLPHVGGGRGAEGTQALPKNRTTLTAGGCGSWPGQGPGQRPADTASQVGKWGLLLAPALDPAPFLWLLCRLPPPAPRWSPGRGQSAEPQPHSLGVQGWAAPSPGLRCPPAPPTRGCAWGPKAVRTLTPAHTSAPRTTESAGPAWKPWGRGGPRCRGGTGPGSSTVGVLPWAQSRPGRGRGHTGSLSLSLRQLTETQCSLGPGSCLLGPEVPAGSSVFPPQASTVAIPEV